MQIVFISADTYHLPRRSKIRDEETNLKASHCLKLSIALVSGLGASATAHADGSVRLYGVVDNYIGSVKPSGAAGRPWQLDSGGETTPFWGMSGEEDLGGGLSSVFAIEGFFRADTGEAGRNATDPFFARNAYVGLSSDRFGELRIGRNSTPMYYLTGQFNPFAGSTKFSPLNVQSWIATFGQVIHGGTNWGNSARYISPRLGGFSIQLIYALGEAANTNGNNNLGGIIRYQSGPVDLAVGANHTKFGSGVTALEPSQKVLIAGVSYNFKVVKLFGSFNTSKNGQSELRTNTYQAGISVPLGRGQLNASYVWTKNDRSSLDDFNRATAGIGYTYNLSKRTDVYANYLYDKLTTAGTGNSFGLGLRHKF